MENEKNLDPNVEIPKGQPGEQTEKTSAPKTKKPKKVRTPRAPGEKTSFLIKKSLEGNLVKYLRGRSPAQAARSAVRRGIPHPFVIEQFKKNSDGTVSVHEYEGKVNVEMAPIKDTMPEWLKNGAIDGKIKVRHVDLKKLSVQKLLHGHLVKKKATATTKEEDK